MKRNKLYILGILLFFFCLTTNVEALCTSKKYNNLKMTAYKAEVNYELKFDSNHNYYFQIVVNNVDKDVLVKFNGFTYEPIDGMIKIQSKLPGGTTYDVNLYGGYNTACVEELLYTKKITIPKYNVYSERDECIEYEEFYLCNKWYSGSITNEESFLNELNRYIESLKEDEKEEKIIKDKNIFEKIIDFYVNNLVFTLPITAIILVFILYKVIVKIIRRRNRIKLNID